MDTLVTFGQWVKARRRSLDLTQEQLARQVDCSAAAIKKIEADERRPSRQVAALLANGLHVNPEEVGVFVRVARGELSLDRLPPARLDTPAPPPEQAVRALPRVSPPPAPGAPARPLESIPASTRPLPRVNIPQPATSLVGRERELEKILALLQDSDCRMFTLTGVGGAGKTRLAIEAAIHLRMAFANGVFFVSLASADSPALIVPAIANAMEVTFSGPGDGQRQLFQYLRDKNILLVLDNLEHLLEGAALFSELLQHAPGVKLLLTSREQLHLQPEWVFEVRGLPVPGETAPGGEAPGAPSSSAVQLFIQRARQVKTDFQAGADEVVAIGRICQLVQGLPLAIELAARWTRTLTCAEIAEEIERGLELLSDGKPGTREGAAHRHRSMRAVFDHSWALLTGEEQHVLKRLSVFRGGFRREAAGQVSGAGLPVLSALIDKSLVWYGESGRYSMHDLVRQYLAEHLAQDPAEEKSALRQHSRYYLTLLQKSEPALRSPRQKNALQTLDEDIDNIRLAWNTAVEWAAQEMAAQEMAAQEVPAAQEMSAANEELPEAAGLLCSAAEPLYYFYELHQYFKEAEGQFRRAAEPVRQALAGGSFAGKARERLVILLAGLLNFQGFFNQRPGNNPAAQALFEESLALQRPLPLSAADRFPLTFALVHLGVVRWAMGDFEQAARYLEEGLAHSQLLQVIWLRSLALGFLGGVNHDRGDYPAAQSLLREAVATCQAEGDPEINMLMVIYYTRTLLARNRLEEARALLMEGLKQVQETGNRWLTGLGLEYLARIARAAGQDREALRLMEESILLHREVGDQWSLSLGLVELCRALLRASAYGLAEQHALEALKIALDTGYTPIALEALVILASVDAGQGRTAEAMILITHILQHPASKQDTREQAEALRSEIATGLTPTQMSELEERARMKAFEAFLIERYGIA